MAPFAWQSNKSYCLLFHPKLSLCISIRHQWTEAEFRQQPDSCCVWIWAQWLQTVQFCNLWNSSSIQRKKYLTYIEEISNKNKCLCTHSLPVSLKIQKHWVLLSTSPLEAPHWPLYLSCLWSSVYARHVRLCDPVDCSPPGSSVHGISQAWILEWVATFYSRGSSRPRDQIQVSCTAGGFFSNWATVSCLGRVMLGN